VRLPLLSPPFLIPLGLVLLVGREGVLTRGLGLEWSVEGFAGIVAAQALNFLAPATRLLTDALAGIEASLEEAARTLGAGELATLSHVTLALARSGVIAAALGVFGLALGDFATPFVLGGGLEVLTTVIYARAVAGGDPASAATLAVILLVPCLVLWALTGARSVGGTLGGVPTGPAVSAVTRRVGCAVGAGATFALATVYAMVVARAVLHLGPDGWSVAGLLAPLAGSLATATAAGVAGTVLALGIAYTVERQALGAMGASTLAAVSLLPAALPGAVLGLGYLLVFSRPAAGSLWILAVSIVAWMLPAAVVVARSAVARIEPAMEEAARSLGASTAETVRRIVLPLLERPALAIFAWFFGQGLLTVGVVVFLVDSRLPLASVTGLVAARDGDLGQASVLATLLLANAAGAVLGLRRLAARQRTGLLAL
jgi:iron(III) transport system permease protein